jgi:serine/threonine-protein kinase
VLGRTVSHYDITDRLGEGAMGEVFAARDTLLGRRVAIKIMQTGDLTSEESRLRFLQEARAASALNHPNIITIYDVVRDRDVDCIVMELIDGETLHDRLSAGKLPYEQALEIIDRIADALAAAHSHGIIHRDLKPANVMLTKTGIVKILDFGLAKLLGNSEGNPDATPMLRTQSGVVVGTPCYMSPEQVLGQKLDGRSDVFSLGSIAAEMLTGSNPFEAESVIATMHQIAYGEVPAMKEVPEPAKGLVLRMLARDKEARFQSAGEVRRAIADVRAGIRIAQPRITKTRHLPNRRRVALGAGALAILIAVMVVVAPTVTRMRAGTAKAASAPAAATQPMPHTAPEHVRRAGELLSTHWRKGYVDSAIQEYQRAIALDPNHAAAHAGLALAYWRKYDTGKDKAWLDLSVKNARHAAELDPQLATAHVALGVAEVASGNTGAGRKELEQTLITDPDNALAHRWLSNVASAAKDDQKAEAELRKAIAIEPRNADLYNVMGWFFYKGARYDESAASFRRAIELAPDYAPAYRNLGAVLHMRGDYPGAARAFQQSLEIEPDGAVYSNLGTLYFFQGLYPQSVSAYEKAVQLGANNHVVWANLGDAYRWTPGNEAKARQAFATALNLLGDEILAHPDDATLQSRKALYLAKQGDTRNARATADALMKEKEKNPNNLYRIALAFELTGARDKSLDALTQAIRNGYSKEEVKSDPELAPLRRDAQFQRMMADVQSRAD